MSLRISRILHAGYVFESDQTKIAFDPIFENPFSRNCYAFPSVEFDPDVIRGLRFDAVFISHFHDDHFSLESLEHISRDTPIYFYCLFPELLEMLRDFGFQSVHALVLNQPIRIGSLEVIARRALDAEVDSIFEIRAGDVSVLNVVDSWIDDDTLELLSARAPWDLILWPFQTMREIEVLAPIRISEDSVEVGAIPHEWIDQLRMLNPRYLVPSSCQFIHENWSWYNQALFPMTYRRFEDEMRVILPRTEVVRLNPSISISVFEGQIVFEESLPWVLPQGDQNVDYPFDPNRLPPPVSEVAKNFGYRDDVDRARVAKFCEVDLPERFRALALVDEPYFEKPRRWRLRVYDGEGESIDYHYKIHRTSIERVAGQEAPLGWLTEIPGAKIFAALEDGESLTSLYLRINAIRFDEATEFEIKEVDLVHDPLIRSLYSGDVGAYQAAQLKRILKRRRKI